MINDSWFEDRYEAFLSLDCCDFCYVVEEDDCENSECEIYKIIKK